MTNNATGPPATAPATPNGRVRLDTWKAIAAYLDRDVRTAERWAKTRGLPVHRTPGDKGHSVFAFQDELDKWLTGDEGPAANEAVSPSPAWRRPVVVAIGILVLAVVVAVLMSTAAPAHGPVQTIRVAGNTVIGIDQQGRTAWTVTYPRPLLSTPVNWIGDPATDGGASVVLGLELYRDTHFQGQLDWLSRDGTVKWSYVPADELQFVGGHYLPPWGSTAVQVYQTAAGRRVAWATHHHTWWPSILMILDEHGKRLEQFVNPGWITALGVTYDRRYLLAAGVNQEHDALMLAVLDAAHVEGSAPTRQDSTFSCLSCPPGRPLKYFVLPYTELRAFGDRGLVRPTISAFQNGAFELRVPPGADSLPNAEVIYEFSASLDLVAASASDPYWDWHRRLQAQGLVHHTAEACPERGGFAAREWTTRSGWRTLEVPARPRVSR